MVPTDCDLVLAARGGDGDAFATLVERHRDAICAIADALVGPGGLREDVAQETLLRAWRGIDSIKDPSRFRAWLRAVARRTSLRALRSLHGRRAGERLPDAVGELPSSEPSPLERAIGRQEAQSVARALGRMPHRYLVPLMLYYGEKQSVEKMAEVLALTDSSVRQRLSRGRRMLRTRLRRGGRLGPEPFDGSRIQPLVSELLAGREDAEAEEGAGP